jgi:hypothetical protein
LDYKVFPLSSLSINLGFRIYIDTIRHFRHIIVGNIILPSNKYIIKIN